VGDALIDTEIMAGVRGVVLCCACPVAGACSIGRGACSVICERRTAHSVRFHAERFDLAAARMRDLGAFWTARDAVDCLRYLR
jgi:hypothetical protein